ncbi:hypothetical protein SLEP1_g13775 [Rubroshorea leprosula]|uniref:non-specific serine/threonine protein kinase n=1 Tax=Rubroshorea leprosula TaxID=152421 RepID=A0AAV5IMS7_9ROSI|nr:hypothetical protein SLEP1_g13775 [Rubroshorea leprosula]
MHLFLWQRLPLLILIQLLEPNYTSHKLYAEALLICKSRVCSPQHSSLRSGRFPCLRQWAFANCYEQKDPEVVTLIPGISCCLSFPARLIQLSSVASVLFQSSSPIHLQEQLYRSRNRRIAASIDADNSVPTLTPVQANDLKKSKKQTSAAIIGGASGALLVIIVLVIVYICLMRVKRFMRRTSETGSSIPSSPTELQRVNTSQYPGAVSPYGPRSLKQLTMMELKHATSNFSESNIIGEGIFGLVYKGLLQDGSIVAIKRCLHIPVQSFLQKVKQIAQVSNKHLVKLVGYYEASNQQLLVYDYIPNGNIGNYLYDNEGLPTGQLNMRQRLLIALGAAKGLEHLHSLVPPLLHMHFRSSNVLLDENFTAKVSDFGLSKLVSEHHSGASSSAFDCFLDPELYSSKNYSAQSDVYSFGVFLLELISGRATNCRNQLHSEANLVLQAKECSDVISFVDQTLGDDCIRAAKQIMKLALQCINMSLRRPSMRNVVKELERIQEREVGHLHLELGEEIGAVTLGSELFK